MLTKNFADLTEDAQALISYFDGDKDYVITAAYYYSEYYKDYYKHKLHDVTAIAAIMNVFPTKNLLHSIANLDCSTLELRDCEHYTDSAKYISYNIDKDYPIFNLAIYYKMSGIRKTLSILHNISRQLNRDNIDAVECYGILLNKCAPVRSDIWNQFANDQIYIYRHIVTIIDCIQNIYFEILNFKNLTAQHKHVYEWYKTKIIGFVNNAIDLLKAFWLYYVKQDSNLDVFGKSL